MTTAHGSGVGHRLNVGNDDSRSAILYANGSLADRCPTVILADIPGGTESMEK